MAQKKEINLTQMHINGNFSCIINKNSLQFLQGLCNTVIDNPGQVDKHKLVTSVLSFLETDTVLFYGEEPPELLKAQIENLPSEAEAQFYKLSGPQLQPALRILRSGKDSDHDIFRLFMRNSLINKDQGRGSFHSFKPLPG